MGRNSSISISGGNRYGVAHIKHSMKKPLLIFALAGAVLLQFLQFSLFAEGFDQDRLKVLHRTTKSFVDEGQHSGIVTLLMHDGKVSDHQAYGYRDLEKKLPMEKDTICRIYSMSKIITSVGVLILLEEGKFNLDDPIEKYIPELKGMKVLKTGSAESTAQTAARSITIRHLLTHTSGLIYDFDEKDKLGKMYKDAALWAASGMEDFIKKVAGLPLKHQPGDEYSYGINTDVLGALIERVSGQRFGEFLRERIFIPLQMKDTGFDVPPNKRDRVAKTYKRTPDGKLVPAEPIIETWPDVGLESGGGGLFSTALDYGRFGTMLLNGGTLGGKRILGRKTVELMTANHLLLLPDQVEVAKRAQGFGLGVEVQQDLGRGALPGSPGAFGWYGAATTYARIDPKERVVAVALAQHFPFNEFNFFGKFATGYYQALK